MNPKPRFAAATRRLRPAPGPRRRGVVIALACGVGALFAGCAASSPPMRLYRMPLAPPAGSVPPVARERPAGAAAPSNWQLVGPVLLPAYLDRDALLVPSGPNRLAPLDSDRWAEPLRDAVPRFLRLDLEARLGPGHVWSSPPPAGVVITRRVRVELLAFDITADRRGVRLAARWSMADPAHAEAPPEVGKTDFTTASSGSDLGSLVTAHRVALARLAEQIAGRPGGSTPDPRPAAPADGREAPR